MFTSNVVVLIIFNIVYNAKKKRAIKECVIEITFIDIDRAKIANIILNSLCFDAIKI